MYRSSSVIAFSLVYRAPSFLNDKYSFLAFLKDDEKKEKKCD